MDPENEPTNKDESDRFKIYPFKNAPDEEKEQVISGFAEITAKHALQVFKSLGLKAYFECMIIDENTKEEYILSFKKVETKS